MIAELLIKVVNFSPAIFCPSGQFLFCQKHIHLNIIMSIVPFKVQSFSSTSKFSYTSFVWFKTLPDRTICFRYSINSISQNLRPFYRNPRHLRGRLRLQDRAGKERRQLYRRRARQQPRLTTNIPRKRCGWIKFAGGDGRDGF